MSGVDIGFAESCEKWEVESRLFPSKIGGKPAWLDLSNVPSSEELECEICKVPMIFLCQVYAPYEEDDDNFHRALFVFVCRTITCNQADGVKVFRSHLRRDNGYYPFEPPIQTPDPTFSLSRWVELCWVCGCRASKHCSKCQKAAYCCRQHQVLDWKENHRNDCGKDSDVLTTSSLLFTEHEIVIEPEEIENKSVDEEKEMKEYEDLASQGETGTMQDYDESDLQAHASVDVDKIFTQFRKRIANNPEQILRYERGGEPLWIASEPKPAGVPNCEYCGGPRQFEFQVMPQMLTVLKETDLDWGVLAVYTCKSSCVTGDHNYKNEFVFKQNVSSS